MTNAYVASNSVPLDGLPGIKGVVQKFLVSVTNTGNATYAPDGLAAAPIFGLGGQQLQGGEIVSGGVATLVSYIGPLLNAGALCWVLFDCTGGSVQVAPATASLQAVQVAQVPAVVGDMREMRGAVSGGIFSVVLNEIGVKTAIGGVGHIVSGISGLTFNPANVGVGGMDTGTAPASGYVAVYVIYNPTTETAALLGQAEVNPIQPSTYTGANMPGGYTLSALCSILPTTSGSALVAATQRGRTVTVPAVVVLSTSTLQPVYAAIPVSVAIPLSACRVAGYGTIGNSTVGATTVLHIASSATPTGENQIASAAAHAGRFDVLISDAQQIFWANNVSGGTPSQSIAISEYEFQV